MMGVKLLGGDLTYVNILKEEQGKLCQNKTRVEFVKKIKLRFIKEPRDSYYRKLISYPIGECDTFVLVIRDSLPLEEPGKKLLESLKPFLKLKTTESEWPGTKLFSGVTATVYKFAFCAALATIVENFSSGLFEWVQPVLPEDLCLLRPDGTPWLVTIAHEKEGYLELTADENVRLFTAMPELSGFIKPGRMG